MSTVRMCDFAVNPDKICGVIFSEREVGWSTGFLTVIDDDGKPHTETADFCPDHTSQPRKRKGMIPRFVPNQLPTALPPSPTSTPTDPFVESPPQPHQPPTVWEELEHGGGGWQPPSTGS